MDLGPPDMFWRQTPALFLVAVRARNKRMLADQRERAWAAWHSAMLPHLKKPPSLAEFLAVRKAEPPKTGKAAVAEIDLAMRKWRVVLATAADDEARRADRRRQRRTKTTPTP